MGRTTPWKLIGDRFRFQQLCAAAKIYPCVLDATVFASFDRVG